MTDHISRRYVLALSAALATGSMPISRAFAAGYPERPITLIVPYSPGGGTDIAARLIAPGLQEELKQPVVVINKPGAGSIIGIQYVSHAAPDGYTLLFTACDGMVMDPAIYENLPYDPVKDFAPISDAMTFPLFVIVKADSPFETLKDLVAYLREHPDKANYSSASAVFWLGTELFGQQAGLKLTRVPYKGAGDMVLAVLQGEVAFSLPSPPPVLGQAKAGSIRILATTSPSRLPGLPDVPTMVEAGVPGVVVTDWSGMWAPANTPGAVIERLNNAIRQVLSSPTLVERAKQLNLGVAGSDVAGVKEKMTSDLTMWRSVAQKAHISMKL
jgi:tripartite-type tricarboxylate transporter receptor subunit TctC